MSRNSLTYDWTKIRYICTVSHCERGVQPGKTAFPRIRSRRNGSGSPRIPRQKINAKKRDYFPAAKGHRQRQRRTGTGYSGDNPVRAARPPFYPWSATGGADRVPLPRMWMRNSGPLDGPCGQLRRSGNRDHRPCPPVLCPTCCPNGHQPGATDCRAARK